MAKSKFDRDTDGNLINKDRAGYNAVKQRKQYTKDMAMANRRIKQLERKIFAFEARISKLENK